jgi:hypothetical protein
VNYSDNPADVRVDFFKESGKYYFTERMRWLDYNATLIHDAFRESLIAHLRCDDGTRLRMAGMWAVCLDPYHKNAFPLMVKVSTDWLINKPADEKPSPIVDGLPPNYPRRY